MPIERSARSVAPNYADDLARLRDAGVSDHWYLNRDGNRQYVVAYDPHHLGHNQTIARLIVEAKPGQIVKYRDGDTLNLRRENLYVARTEKERSKTPIVGPEGDRKLEQKSEMGL